MNCRFCGKEIDEKSLYGKGLFCNRSCQARFNCKQNSENRKGYLVYRVDWNEISTETGRNSMEVKVKDFLKFYESI